jgi:hypothetical protein
MIWTADFALVYAYALTLFAALLLWILPKVFFATVTAVSNQIQKPASAPRTAAPSVSRSRAQSRPSPQLAH